MLKPVLFAILTISAIPFTATAQEYGGWRPEPPPQDGGPFDPRDPIEQPYPGQGRIETSARARATGYSPRQCIDEARRQAEWDSRQIIDDCERQLQYRGRCEIAGLRVVGYPDMIRPISSVGTIDSFRTTEQACRADAEMMAERNSVRDCENIYNMRCSSMGRASYATHNVERRRRFGIVGPKEYFHMCSSRAEAMPNTRDRFTCEVEVFAQPIRRY